jgi:hypothetical protein
LKKNDIEYYSNWEKRGYLAKDPNAGSDTFEQHTATPEARQLP